MKKWKKYTHKTSVFFKKTKFNFLKMFHHFLVVAVFLSYSASLYAVKFIDIDEFNFVKGGQKAGLRVCTFDSENQRYDSICYYTFPTTESRRPSGILFHYNNLEVDFNGNVKIKSLLQNVIVRTKGIFQELPAGLPFVRDDQTRNLAFYPFESSSPTEIKKSLDRFKKGTYGKSSFKVSFYSYPTSSSPSWPHEQKLFGTLSQDRDENNRERGVIGELATRMAFFSHGYFFKFSTQDGSGQGIDGIYAKRNERGELAALFLTESKCKNESMSPQKIMESQLNEKLLYENIGRIEPSQKSIILDFIDQKPDLVFKAAHRILIDGSSEWLVKPLEIRIFRTLRMGISSSEKDKEAFIEMIALNFRSPEELLRAAFNHYKLNEDEQINIFCKVISPEKLSQFGLPLVGSSRPGVVRRLILPTCSSSEEASTLCKQEPDTFQITSPSSSSLQFAEQPEEIIKLEAVAAKQETRSHFVQEIEYNRDNLARLLTYIKAQYKQHKLKTINYELLRVDPAFKPLLDCQLSFFSDYEQYSNQYRTYDYQNLWKLLLRTFPKHYQQAIVVGIFKKDT